MDRPHAWLSPAPRSRANADTAEQLRSAAEAACCQSERLMEDAVRRRSARDRLTPEAVERLEHTAMRLEMALSRREMRHADLEAMRRLRVEERETAELERWIRQQAASMLRDGWTPEELAEIGMDARYTADPAPTDGKATR